MSISFEKLEQAVLYPTGAFNNLDNKVYSSDDNYVDNIKIYLDDINSHRDSEFVYRGYTCIISLMKRNTWNGYVVLNSSHKCYNLHHLDTLKSTDPFYIDVHGGLNYSSTNDESTVIGFSTGHIGDFIPVHLHGDVDCNFRYASYKTFDWVEREIKKLVDKLEILNEDDEDEVIDIFSPV